MKNLKHTPAPWKNYRNPMNKGIENIIETDKKLIAFVKSEDMQNVAEFEANAKLIASAHELLEALIPLMDFWIDKDDNEQNQELKIKLAHACPEIQLYCENAKNAIKKATE